MATITEQCAGLSIRHLWSIAAHVNMAGKNGGAGIGFDANRDERTKGIDNCRSYVVSTALAHGYAHSDEAGYFRTLVSECAKHLANKPAKRGRGGRFPRQPAAPLAVAIQQAIPQPQPQEPHMPQQQIQPIQVNHAPGADLGAAGQQIAAILAGLAQPAPQIDESAVTAIVQRELAQITLPRRVIVETRDPAGASIERNIGLAHRQFTDLLTMSNARDNTGQRMNVWLSGPAGSGKTTAARQVAEALGVPFYFTGAIDTEYKLIGFTDATGKTVRRPFRDAFSKPSVFLFDEVDASGASAVLALNAALANGHCDFPDALEARHTDCTLIAAANTWGDGATHDYTGRMKLDKAFLDRFVMLAWDYDPALEQGMAPDFPQWVKYVQDCRAKARRAGIKCVISPRATSFGAALLRAGMDRDSVIRATIRKGLDDATWAKVAA